MLKNKLNFLEQRKWNGKHFGGVVLNYTDIVNYTDTDIYIERIRDMDSETCKTTSKAPENKKKRGMWKSKPNF